MTLDALIMLAGAIVAASPFLGFPRSDLQWILFACGLCVLALGIAVRRRLFQKTRSQRMPIDEYPKQ